MKTIDPILENRLETLINGMGFELAGCEILSRGKEKLCRIYIDSLSNDAGVTIDECSQVSHQVSAMIDVEELIQGHYVLEVSSPGIDRLLFKLDHFKKFIGKCIKFKLCKPVNRRRQFKGMLQHIEGDDLSILLDDSQEIIKVAFIDIEKANVVGEVRFNKKIGQ